MISRATGIFLLLAIAGVPSCRKQEPIPIAERGSDDSESPSPGDAIITKLDSIIIPVIDFEDASVEEAIDYLRVRSLELDKEEEPGMGGISMFIHGSKDQADSSDGLDGSSASGETPGTLRIARYRAKDVSFLEALTETCRLAELDAYLTSVGIVICPKGHEPFPNPKSEHGEVWKQLTR